MKQIAKFLVICILAISALILTIVIITWALILFFGVSDVNPRTVEIASSLVSDLRVDSELDGNITMAIDVSAYEQILMITVNNHSDFEINLGSQSPNRIQRPSFQYFDGDAWRTVPRTSYLGPIDVYEFGLEKGILPEEEREIIFNFEHYHLPEVNLFRIVLRARGEDPRRGYGVNAQFRHDFFAEFILE